MVRLGWPVVAVVMIAGCNKSDFRVDHPFTPDTKAMILLGAQEHATVSGAKEWSFKAPDVSRDEEGRRTWFLPLKDARGGGSETLGVRVDAGCGPVRWCLGAIGEKGNDGVIRTAISGRKLREVCSPMGYDLYFDNRGGAERTLTVGPAIRVTLPANTTGVVPVPPPSCDAAATVAIDGRSIGSLPVVSLDLGWDDRGQGVRDFLIDPGAGRCYVSTRFTYAATSSIPGGGPSSDMYSGKELHALEDDITDFLEKAPDSITTYGGFGSRTQLLPTDCPPSPAEPR